MGWFFLSLAVPVVGGLLAFAALSRLENEARATRVSLLLALVSLVLLGGAATIDFPGRGWVGASLAAGLVLAGGILAWPDRGLDRRSSPRPAARYDERATMFSRRELATRPEAAARWYAEHPEHRAPDERWRSRPGLMSARARHAHPTAFAAADASFRAVEELHPLVEGEPTRPPTALDAERASRFLQGWARHLGAVDAGITRLDPLHVYSVGGRRERRDRPVEAEHPFALAFTVEMDHSMMQSAPDAPTLMESAQQYLGAGAIAVQLATAIRSLGYRARAHVDANYQLVCPLVARDAGLGEIGRMGLLMTPTHGPRVRIGVVTTDLPLIETRRAPDPSVEDFCLHCRKCARVCPSQAIPFGDVSELDGVRRWKIDDEACFTYWCDAGTDCGRCVVVCPYSHPHNPAHDLVRAGIRRSGRFRRLALWADDLFYGRRPRPRPLPGWLER